jgi:hypothetical protein
VGCKKKVYGGRGMIEYNPVSSDSFISAGIASILWSYIVLFQFLKSKNKDKE